MAATPQSVALPGVASRPVSSLSLVERFGEAIRRSLPHLSPEARAQVEALLSPEALALLAATVSAWLVSHAFGVGIIADIALIIGGALALGWTVFQMAEELWNFAYKASNARTERDLDEAGRHFARAVSIGGVGVVITVLTRGAGRSLRNRVPRIAGPPPPGRGLRSNPRTTRDPNAPAGTGQTGWYGDITVSTRGSVNDQRLVELHESVHRFFSPRLRLFQELRADLRALGYSRSTILRYLEEALAETYAQLRVNGTSGLLDGLRFPLHNSYYNISIQRVAREAGGILVGTISVGGSTWTVYLVARSQSE